MSYDSEWDETTKRFFTNPRGQHTLVIEGREAAVLYWALKQRFQYWLGKRYLAGISPGSEDDETIKADTRITEGLVKYLEDIANGKDGGRKIEKGEECDWSEGG